MIELRIKDFERLPIFQNNENLRRRGDQLYKKINEYNGADIDFIQFLRNIHKIPGVALPNHLLVSPGFIPGIGVKPYGYTMDLIEGINLDKFLHYQGHTDIDIVKTVNALFSILERIHKDFIFGDVRNGNILITPNGPVFIDAENGKELKNDSDAFCYYNIAVDDNTLGASLISDTLKTLLSALSIYYGVDFERLYMNQDIVYLLELLHSIKAPDAFIFYLDSLIEDALCNPNATPKSFSEYSDDLRAPTDEDKERLIRKL